VKGGAVLAPDRIWVILRLCQAPPAIWRIHMNFTPAQKQSLSWLGIAAAFALIVWLLGPVLTPFVVAAVLAYALHPFVERLAARKVPRLLAVTVVEVLLVLALLTLLLLIVPILSKELPLLREQIPILGERLNAWLAPFLAQFGIKFTLDVASLKAFVLKYLNTNFEDGLPHSWPRRALAAAWRWR
jgi:predicted PurR-regulated permease PerM